jgi:hypothetical protein
VGTADDTVNRVESLGRFAGEHDGRGQGSMG